ncbi:hypothetical protein SAY86_025509 [Trapa natans]|uniref:Uncharacterized protein n=1 Tax=Trapa natans TaxID=22666 RepID=A0AAN7M8E4_TRANT|nr:hypothetical protein SAY86_025509 [Trapa natans]
MGILALMTGWAGPSGFGSATTAEQVTEGIDASGLTAIITGGASGIGLETSRVLALRGAHVVIGARNMEAAKEAKKAILDQCETAKVDILKLDLCSMKSIASFAKSFHALNLPLNILINNAGIMFCPFQLAEDGTETQFATNHIGHFLLTNLLLDKMKHTARVTGIQGRIVNLSSIAHSHTYQDGIQFDKINDELRSVLLSLFLSEQRKEYIAYLMVTWLLVHSYNTRRAYGQSKLANILHANELSRRLQEEGANITVNSVHPGLIMTNLMRHTVIIMKILKMFTCLLWKNVPQGAATTCYAALHPSLRGVTGKYYADCNELEPSDFAKDVKLGKKLWDFSSKMVEEAVSL